MSPDSARHLKLSNGLRIAVFVGLLTLFGQLAVVVWGAATLSARVTVVETNQVDLSGLNRVVQRTMNIQAVDIAEMGVMLDNIDEKVDRILDRQ